MSEENQSNVNASKKEAMDESKTENHAEVNGAPSDVDHSATPEPQNSTDSVDINSEDANSEAASESSIVSSEADAESINEASTAPESPEAELSETHSEPIEPSEAAVEVSVEPPEKISEVADAPEVDAEISEQVSQSVSPAETAVDSSETENNLVTETASESPETESELSEDEVSSVSEESREEQPRIGYTGEIIGEVVSLSSLEAEQDPLEEQQAGADELIKLIDGSLSKVSQDEIVSGRIISVGEKDVVIDIGFKSDGVISKSEFSGEVEPGDEVEVYLERLENYHGQLVLSKGRAEQIRRWEQVEEAFRNGTVLEGTIVRRIKGGMIVDLIDGLEAFLPGSQIDMRPVRDFDSYLDRKMEFKIVKVNAENENVVVSHKALIERELASQRESILSTMETGQVLEGVAKNITDFGVFVDLGGVDGLLHITDLTWGRISHPTEVVSLDEELKVVVLEYDRERQRISLGLRQLQPHPWENIEERYKPGDIVEGKVVSITDYGAFLELEQGIEGLVHVSEMSWTGHIRHPSQRVSLGQVVKVSVLSIDHDTQKISLGMKQFEVNPWEGIAMRYPPGTVLRGSVRNITHFGAFVEIEPGIDGLVHVSDLSWTKTIRHPSELIKKRQELSVVVLDVDEKRQRIALGHKQIETNPWTNLATVYEVGTDHKAKVIRIDRRGLTVELPLEVEALVPRSELKKKNDGGFPPYQEGDELDLRVIRLDPNQKEIVMSETAKKRQEEAKAREKENKAKRAERREEEKAVRRHAEREKITSGPTTIGEMSGLESLKEKMEVSQEIASEAKTKIKTGTSAAEVAEETTAVDSKEDVPDDATEVESDPSVIDEATEQETVAEISEVDDKEEVPEEDAPDNATEVESDPSVIDEATEQETVAETSEADDKEEVPEEDVPDDATESESNLSVIDEATEQESVAETSEADNKEEAPVEDASDDTSPPDTDAENVEPDSEESVPEEAIEDKATKKVADLSQEEASEPETEDGADKQD
ncbi:MAG: 30S ribosomal protein S1 [Bacteroidetes bacterium]|nr:30S ribosomal protein S1 [Bacteroidota bacterium]